MSHATAAEPVPAALAAGGAPTAGTGLGALTPAPAPGGAPAWRCVLAHAAIETRVHLRNPEQLLVAVVLPLLALVVLARSPLVAGTAGSRVDVAVPGVLALCVLSTAFVSLAITTGFERQHGVLRRLGATPLSRGGLLAGKALSTAVVVAGQVVVVATVGLALGWHPHAARPALAVVEVVLLLLAGIAAIAPLGMLVAGTLPAETTLGVANLVYVLLLGLSAVLVPVSHYPHLLRPVAAALPPGALAEALRRVCAGGTVSAAAIVVLAVWAVVGSFLAVRFFRWD